MEAVTVKLQTQEKIIGEVRMPTIPATDDLLGYKNVLYRVTSRVFLEDGITLLIEPRDGAIRPINPYGNDDHLTPADKAAGLDGK